jgi:hypothetical protein
MGARGHGGVGAWERGGVGAWANRRHKLTPCSYSCSCSIGSVFLTGFTPAFAKAMAGKWMDGMKIKPVPILSIP